MTRARQDRLLDILRRDRDWLTAAALADQLGVTPRSIRSYVTSINARVPTAIESGTHGYRAGPEAAAARARSSVEQATPRDRLHALVRRLLAASGGIDLFVIADELFVSPATIESDLARVRGLLGGTELTLQRVGAQVRMQGSEMAQRRLLSKLVHDEIQAGSFDLTAMRRALGEGSVGARAFGSFKARLVQRLGELGYFVNEFGISDVLMHIAIAADRSAHDRGLTGVRSASPEAERAVAEVLGTLVEEHIGVHLGEADLSHLAALVLTRVVAPRESAGLQPSRARMDPEVEHAVREVVESAASEFLVDIVHAEFIVRLSLHVQNLKQRAQSEAWSRNPLTKSIKASYPMIFEVAVYVAVGLRERLGIPLHDDEIAYIAMHVGGRLERSRSEEGLLTATIVSPGYYELHELLRSRVDRSLGRAIEIIDVHTRVDPDWDALEGDLVLSTIEPPVHREHIVHIQPFLTEADVEKVHAVATRIRRSRRLARLRKELEGYFVPSGFVRGLPDTGEASVIRLLGAPLVAAEIIDENYLDRAVEREELSSTAFTEALAVPHAMGMTASRTAIAMGVSEASIAWGAARVHVVALVAFAESDREAFQTVFEQLVEVFSERESVQRIVRRGTNFSAFLDELVAVIDG